MQVFSVEDRSLQLCWRHLDAGVVAVRAGEVERTVDWHGGPGALTLDGLEPGRPYQVRVTARVRGRSVDPVLATRTLAALDGPELVRFATLSDLHIGSDAWDLLGRMRERGAGVEHDIHTVRCARAALAEAQRWGAQHLFLKGDLTDKGQPDEWDTLGRLLADVPIPVHAIPGNHDRKVYDDRTIPAEDGAARIGLDLITEPTAIDLDGLRVVLFDSTVPELHQGRIADQRREAVAALLAEHDGPCLVATHHYLQRTPMAWFWPPGVPRGQATPFLDAVAAANRRTLVTSGHTHRHRRRSHGPLVLTEVGSPRDYPGTFGGYVVHATGVRQVVRRIEAPEAITWTERTRRGAFGAWGRWSPGRLDDRCFVHRWPD